MSKLFVLYMFFHKICKRLILNFATHIPEYWKSNNSHLIFRPTYHPSILFQFFFVYVSLLVSCWVVYRFLCFHTHVPIHSHCERHVKCMLYVFSQPHFHLPVKGKRVKYAAVILTYLKSVMSYLDAWKQHIL